MSAETKVLYEFGKFRCNPREHLLLCEGKPVSLSPKSFEILIVLIRSNGQLLMKDELMQQVWPDSFVEEANLTVNISALRKVLGETPGGQQYIETVPKRGYRFVAQVTREEQWASATRAVHKRPWKIAVPVSLLLTAGLLAGLLWRWRQTPHLAERDTIVVGDFANSTGDPVFDGTLRQGLSVQLEQSPLLRLASEEQIHQTLRMMGQKSNTQLAAEIAREVCQRTNGAAALDGSIALVGTRYDLVLRAIDCASGNLLASAEAQANDKNSVLDALGKIASEMRGRLGESLSNVQKYNAPLVLATTPSLEALQFYSLGDQTQTETGDFTASLLFFQKAIERDPNFAMAYWAISDTYSNMGESTTSADYIRKAFGLRAGVSELEKLVIEGDYYYYAVGDLMKARRSFEVIAKTYPMSGYAYDTLADFSNAFGQHDLALNQCLEAIRLAPFNSRAHRHIVLTYLLLNRVEDASAAAQEAHANGLDSRMAPVLYGIAFYRGNTAEMARQIASAGGKPGEEDLLWALEADTDAYFGHLQKARELSRQAIDSAERAGEKETAGLYYVVSALREALYGNVYKTQQQAGTAKQYSTERDSDYGLTLALAYADDANRAQQLTDEFERRFPEDSVVRLQYLPTLRAKLAISHSNPQQALEMLGTAAPYELGLPAYTDYNWPNLYSVYVRGEAYLAAHRGPEAAAEFKKILDHRGIVLNEPIGALAHLQLGRAYVLSGDTAKAKLAYQEFLTLWKDADPDIPILKQAKTEYAKLQ